ncbi:MAG TPA: FAD/NAD(P)-binding oxidoreductase [Acidimicrobiales bacterium]|jgi:NADH dehydrogenase FAD-containing subunit|nr:FAD/NAD(P)-binding oxidoreductase [Acidimicrobiales bacterium]
MSDTDGGQPKVVVVGGGYGGVTVAKGLDEVADVVLVEPKAAFLHNVAALRALVDPSWLSKVFMPYDSVLARGRVVRDRAVTVDPGRVVTASGEEIRADYVVLATGSAYPFPAKTDLVDTGAAREQFRKVNRTLAAADRVLLVGAGPVGVELAGEVHAVWPDKAVTLLDTAGQLLGGLFKEELKAELRRQLAELGVELVLGSPLQALPPTEPGEAGTFTVATEDGVTVTADIWFRCFGVVPNSDFLGPDLLPARRADGFVEIGPALQVAGQDTVFAVGDVSTADAKMAGFARREAQVVVDNITALAAGRTELAVYEPMGASAIVIPIGPTGGSGQFPGQEGIVPAETVADLKGRDMMIGPFAELFGLAATAED